MPMDLSLSIFEGADWGPITNWTTTRRSGKSYESILKLIAETFGVQLTTAIHNGTIYYYVIAITSPAKLQILINYLNEYSLFTSKFRNGKDFSSCVDIMLNGSKRKYEQ